jgi:hypothetical protein
MNRGRFSVFLWSFRLFAIKLFDSIVNELLVLLEVKLLVI